MAALTPCERQRRRRARLAAERAAAAPPAITAPLNERETRQEAWDAACETIQEMLERYRVYRATTPAPAAAEPRLQDLHRLSALALTLSLVAFPAAFGTEWHFPDDAPTSPGSLGLDPRPLREQLLGEPHTDPDRWPRTAENDARAREWWDRLPLDARSTWLHAARTTDPIDVWYVLRETLEKIPR